MHAYVLNTEIRMLRVRPWDQAKNAGWKKIPLWFPGLGKYSLWFTSHLLLIKAISTRPFLNPRVETKQISTSVAGFFQFWSSVRYALCILGKGKWEKEDFLRIGEITFCRASCCFDFSVKYGHNFVSFLCTFLNREEVPCIYDKSRKIEIAWQGEKKYVRYILGKIPPCNAFLEFTQKGLDQTSLSRFLELLPSPMLHQLLMVILT